MLQGADRRPGSGGATIVAVSGGAAALSPLMIAGGSSEDALRYGVASDDSHPGPAGRARPGPVRRRHPRPEHGRRAPAGPADRRLRRGGGADGLRPVRGGGAGGRARPADARDRRPGGHRGRGRPQGPELRGRRVRGARRAACAWCRRRTGSAPTSAAHGQRCRRARRPDRRAAGERAAARGGCGRRRPPVGCGPDQHHARTPRRRSGGRLDIESNRADA